MSCNTHNIMQYICTRILKSPPIALNMFSLPHRLEVGTLTLAPTSILCITAYPMASPIVQQGKQRLMEKTQCPPDYPAEEVAELSSPPPPKSTALLCVLTTGHSR